MGFCLVNCNSLNLGICFLKEVLKVLGEDEGDFASEFEAMQLCIDRRGKAYESAKIECSKLHDKPNTLSNNLTEAVNTSIVSSPLIQASKHEEDQCSICLNFLSQPGSTRGVKMSKTSSRKLLAILPCTHVYHCSCLFKWMKTTSLCPICRNSFTKEVVSVHPLRIRKKQQ